MLETPDANLSRAIQWLNISMAQPEKALLDVFYLAPARTRLFCNLPEVERPDGFNVSRAHQIIDRIPFRARINMVAERFAQWLKS